MYLRKKFKFVENLVKNRKNRLKQPCSHGIFLYIHWGHMDMGASVYICVPHFRKSVK